MKITESPSQIIKRPDRDDALDFTKGALVLVMVIYHWFNYFVPGAKSVYLYIRFITPSFILLAGFLVTYLLAGRTGQKKSSLSVRLIFRGLKLMGLFTLLNWATIWIEQGNFSSYFFWGGIIMIYDKIPSIYLIGDGASFLVLQPISYTLMFAALFHAPKIFIRLNNPKPAVIIFIIFSVSVLAGFKLPILELTAFGLLGLILGNVFANKRDLLLKLGPWSLVAYIPHVAAIYFWGVPYTIQLVSVCLNLLLIYWLGSLVKSGSALGRLMLLLGQYSLLGYIGQIAILQILARLFRHGNMGAYEMPISLFSAILLTVLLIAVTDFFRRKSSLVNSLYQFVFA